MAIRHHTIQRIPSGSYVTARRDLLDEFSSLKRSSSHPDQYPLPNVLYRVTYEGLLDYHTPGVSIKLEGIPFYTWSSAWFSLVEEPDD